MARALDGRVLLRVEDHDRQRCRPEYESVDARRPRLARPRARRLSDGGVPRRALRGSPVRPRRASTPRRRSTDWPRAAWCTAAAVPVVRSRRPDRGTGATNCATPARAGIVGLPLDGRPRLAARAIEPGVETFDDAVHGPTRAGPGGAVRRPAAARSSRQLDVSVRGGRRRHGARHRPRHPRRRSVRLDRTPDPAGAPARPRDAAGVPASPPGDEVADAEAEQDATATPACATCAPPAGRRTACSVPRPTPPGFSTRRPLDARDSQLMRALRGHGSSSGLPRWHGSGAPRRDPAAHGAPACGAQRSVTVSPMTERERRRPRPDAGGCADGPAPATASSRLRAAC